MKKTLVSLAAVAALTTGAMAADKGIDIVTTGQAVVYYNTAAKSGGSGANKSQDLFGTSTTAGEKDNTRANYGIQLNLDADLKNGFTFGSTINYLGTLGLEKNLVNDTMQNVNDDIEEDNIADDIYLAQLFIAKKMGNTTLKLGRQELPKSLSPFAFSEGWNVFKNTFDAILAVNTDIPDTTVVGAYVAKANNNGFGHNMSEFKDLSTGAGDVTGATYMLTVQNKSIPMTTLTLSYYDLAQVAGLEDGKNGVQVIWADVAIAGKDLPMGLKIGIQGGTLDPEGDLTGGDETDTTTGYGLKVGLKPIKELALCLAYTSVDGGDNDKTSVGLYNVGGAKTPLYTQMIANQSYIALANNTFMLKGVYNAGDYGKVILQGTYTDDTTDDNAAGVQRAEDKTEIDLVYKVKAAGINWLAAYINQSWDEQTDNAYDTQDIVRFVARYNF